ncbi:hypothetical protein RFI_39631 [Reticulomyxa filosa]|uniref:Uncharacterized protein n=1 Tax=Reticulomyxa filosa TaxID=46433 RepID=X6L997_RETFI|nr:hypothetical protein RFI_39631 [Reticulomyxa filosa]|eukprot:ETN97895.1 hypothetical protein RFI_39631 [Reticulomyxa filosa]
MFEKLKNRDNDKTKKQWLEIMKKLNIPQWNTDDTKCIMNTNSGLLLVLDGFDEIANLTQYVAIFCKLLHIKIFSVFVKVTLLQKKKRFYDNNNIFQQDFHKWQFRVYVSHIELTKIKRGKSIKLRKEFSFCLDYTCPFSRLSKVGCKLKLYHCF